MYKPYNPDEEEFDPYADENNMSEVQPKPMFDDSMLSKLAETDPDLVARYKAKMKGSNDAVASAEKAQKMGGYADVAGQFLTDFNNAGKKDIILKNRMQDLGKRPDVIEAKRDQWKSVAPAFDKQLEVAKGKRKEASDEFFMEDKLTETGKARGKQDNLDDPSSKESQDARDYLKQIAPKSTSFQGYDRLSAAQVKELAPGLFQSYNAEENRAAQSKDRAAAREQTKALRDYTNQGKTNAAEAKQTEKMEQLRIGDLGYAQTPEDAKQLKSAVESKQQFDNRLDELINLREKHNGGALFNREDVGRAQQLSKDLLLQYKDMAKLGVLSAADEKILNAIIPADPLQYSSPMAAVQGQDPTLFKLKKFKEDAAVDFDTKMSNRLRKEGKSKAVTPANASKPSWAK